MHRVLPYRGTGDTVQHMLKIIDGPRGGRSPELREWVEDTIRFVTPRDKLSQLTAIYNRFQQGFRYVNDPVNAEYVKDALRLLDELQKHGVALGDCDDASVFLASAPRTIGIHTGLVRSGFRALSGKFSHVFAVAFDQRGRKIALDPVAGTKTDEMLGRIQAYSFDGG